MVNAEHWTLSYVFEATNFNLMKIWLLCYSSFTGFFFDWIFNIHSICFWGFFCVSIPKLKFICWCTSRQSDAKWCATPNSNHWLNWLDDFILRLFFPPCCFCFPRGVFCIISGLHFLYPSLFGFCSLHKNLFLF